MHCQKCGLKKNMGIYLVEVEVSEYHIELYEVKSNSKSSAKSNWSQGNMIRSYGEGQDLKVIGVKEK